MKLAFCFLVYDRINHEDLWKAFFEGVDISNYSIYIHYKTNIPLKHFEHHKLVNCIETKYCDVTIVHAHNLLFKQAYEDGCDKIISLSQSCIPLKSFDYIYTFLSANTKGHFNICPQSQCFPRADCLLQYYNIDHIQKSSNWFILNRTLCEAMLSHTKEEINKQYSSIYCPEEHYFITTVFEKGLEDHIVTTPNLANGATTFTNWSDMDYKYVSRRGLKNYATISSEELEYLIGSKCLFGRKFNHECAPNLEPLRSLYSVSRSLSSRS